MTSSNLNEQIDSTIEGLLTRFDELDHDGFDIDAGDGKLTVEFDSGGPFIISRQSAADQIWLAEPRGGWHFDWDGKCWTCDKRGVELIETLESLIAGRIGEPINLHD